MATYKSDAVNAGIMPDFGVPAGIVLCRTGTYETTDDSVVSGDTIQLVPMPKGARIIDIKFYCSGDAALATGILLGDGDDTDRFFHGPTFTGDHVYAMDGSKGGNAPGGFDFIFTQDDTIDVLLNHTAGDTKVPTSTIFAVSVIYKMTGVIDDEG